MCGRFVRTIDINGAAAAFGAEDVACDLAPSYNIAPSQPIAVVMEAGERKLVSMRWGLIPRWSRDGKIGYKMINARSETIAEKPSYRGAFKSRRCLIIADGFYEWHEEAGKKHPVYIYRKDRKPFGMAGIYETWVSPEGESITTCSIVTTEANDFMESIHHRMPVILRTEDQDAWLDPANEDVTTLKRLLRSRAPALSCHPVSPEVNSVRNNGPHCISPVNVAQPGK